MKHFLRNINLLNILLICAILMLVNYTVLPLFNMSVRFTLPGAQKPPVYKDKQPAEIDIPLLTDYTMVAENNLFHPERRIPVEKAESQPLERPEFVLYGTLITDDIRLAYLKDRKSPLNTGGRGDRQTAMKIGDTMSGYALKEIYPDKVIMARGEELVSVLVSDSAKRETQSVASPQRASRTLPRQSPRAAERAAKASRPGGPLPSATEHENLQRDSSGEQQTSRGRETNDPRARMRTSRNKGSGSWR